MLQIVGGVAVIEEIHMANVASFKELASLSTEQRVNLIYGLGVDEISLRPDAIPVLERPQGGR